MTSALSGAKVNPYGQRVIEWSLLGPTIFPIFFAAIIGRTMKFVAQYRLEGGASIDALERLIGSQSVFGAFMTQVTMAKLGPLSLAILFIWAFSPIGGQASLRILRTEYNITDTTQFAYLNMTRQLSTFSAGYSTSDSQYSVDALYTGCLIGTPATKGGSQDSWGNLKIPMLETLNESSGLGHWVDIPKSNVTYSSLLGVPITGLPKDRNSSFNTSTYYYNVQCPEIRSTNNTVDWLSPLKIPFTSSYNTSTIFEIQGSTGRNSIFLSSYTNETSARSNGSDTSPVHLILLSRASDNMTSQGVQGRATKISIADCFMIAIFVESNVDCQGKDCRVDKIRNSVSPPGSYFVPPLMMGYSEPCGLLTAGLQSATAVTNLYSTPTEHYLYGKIAFPFAHRLELVNLYNISNVDFSTRLTQIINTYWLASLAPEASTNNLPSDLRDLLAGNSTVLGNSVFPFAANATNATTFYLQEVYQCNRGWLAALIISNVLLFVAGVAGTTMKYMSLGPDVLGYVSSLVAHDPYTTDAGARGNSAMDGLERSRSMHGIRIRLEDVRERDQVGHIAVSTLSGRGESARKLKSGRLYS